MSRRPRAAVVAAALAAAAMLLVGCGGSGGSGDSGDSGAKDREPGVAGPRTPAAGGDADAADGGPSGATAGQTPRGPRVPKSELTPATGSFTKKEKEYLTGRVPEGTDPAAVLQIGQETCQRIARTAEHDRKAAVSAIRTGEIANAEPAVTHLCPEQQPLLEAAKKGGQG
ncbi:hypothetical protein [Streptomyces sp. 7N604]|uniref:hypothetical protein n=1 Tax=Streptomyces sp. 7N604 TaxID=3457415 RepID=UPI003FD5DF4C